MSAPSALFPTMRHYNFKPGRVPALATALLFPLFLSLGLWQQHRAAEKEALIALRLSRNQAAELALAPTALHSLEEIRYRRVVLAGQYDQAHQLLLDNQIVDHQPGYFVLTPLKLPGSEQRILINRGWVPAGPNRSSLPGVGFTGHSGQVRGVVDKFPSLGWRLQGAETPTSGWPGVVQLLDAAALARHLGYPVAPYQVLLDPAEPGGYVRRWTSADPDPVKNRGYALQWFSFATILIALFVWFGFKPKSSVLNSPNSGSRPRD